MKSAMKATLIKIYGPKKQAKTRIADTFYHANLMAQIIIEALRIYVDELMNNGLITGTPLIPVRFISNDS